MYRTLIRNEWLAIYRAAFGRQRIIIRIGLGLLFLVTALYVAGFAFLVAYAFVDRLPQHDLVWVLGLASGGAVVIDLLIRLPIQKAPWSIALPYLTLPLRKERLSTYILLKSFLIIPNVLLATGIIAFSSGLLSHPHAGLKLALQNLGILLVIHNAVMRLKGFGETPLFTRISQVISLACGALVILAVAAYRGWLPLSQPDRLGRLMSPSYELAFGVWALGLFATYRSRAWIRRNLYADPSGTGRKRSTTKANSLGWLRFEWLMIVRNRRTKGVLVPLWIVFLWMPMFGDITRVRHGISVADSMICMFYAFAAMVALPIMINESTIYDRLTTLPVSWSERLRRKLIVARTIYLYHAATFSILLLFLGVSATTVLLLILFYLVSLPAGLYQASFHRTRYEIDQRAVFNFQGGDSSIPLRAQVPTLACMFIPALMLVVPGYLTGSPVPGKVSLAVLTVALFLMQRPISTRLVELLRRNHYSRSAGYRQRV